MQFIITSPDSPGNGDVAQVLWRRSSTLSLYCTPGGRMSVVCCPSHGDDASVTQAEFIGDLVGLESGQALVVVGVIADLKAVARQQAGNFRVLLGADADKKKRRRNVALVQQSDDRRAITRVGAVVNRQGDFTVRRIAVFEQSRLRIVAVFAAPVLDPI